MPTLAILSHELHALASSWLVRLWLIATALLAFLVVAGSWAQVESAWLIASLESTYLVLPWFFVVIVLGISPVTGTRLDALADGILSRPVTRYEYLFASWLARVLIVLAVFLAVMVPTVMLVVFAKRPVAPDGVTVYGTAASLVVVSLVLTFLVTLSFCAGTLLRNSLLAAVVLVFVWMPVNVVLDTFALEEFSPISLARAMPVLLRTEWNPDEPVAVDRARVEDIAEMMRATNHFLSVMSGAATPAKAQEGNFFEQRSYPDFSLWRVLLGYGLPTLAGLGLSMLFFCWRDL